VLRRPTESESLITTQLRHDRNLQVSQATVFNFDGRGDPVDELSHGDSSPFATADASWLTDITETLAGERTEAASPVAQAGRSA
jgi:hypothetical protein